MDQIPLKCHLDFLLKKESIPTSQPSTAAHKFDIVTFQAWKYVVHILKIASRLNEKPLVIFICIVTNRFGLLTQTLFVCVRVCVCVMTCSTMVSPKNRLEIESNGKQQQQRRRQRSMKSKKEM